MDHVGAARPFVDGVIPTTLDKELMPEGVHFFSMYTQWWLPRVGAGAPSGGAWRRTPTA